MKITENQTNKKNTVFSHKKKYEAIAHSKIYVTTNSNIGTISSVFNVQD